MFVVRVLSCVHCVVCRVPDGVGRAIDVACCSLFGIRRQLNVVCCLSYRV